MSTTLLTTQFWKPDTPHHGISVWQIESTIVLTGVQQGWTLWLSVWNNLTGHFSSFGRWFQCRILFCALNCDDDQVQAVHKYYIYRTSSAYFVFHRKCLRMIVGSSHSNRHYISSQNNNRLDLTRLDSTLAQQWFDCECEWYVSTQHLCKGMMKRDGLTANFENINDKDFNAEHSS